MTKINVWSLFSESMIPWWQTCLSFACIKSEQTNLFFPPLYYLFVLGIWTFYWSMKAGGGFGNGDNLHKVTFFQPSHKWLYLVYFVHNLAFWSLIFLLVYCDKFEWSLRHIMESCGEWLIDNVEYLTYFRHWDTLSSFEDYLCVPHTCTVFTSL